MPKLTILLLLSLPAFAFAECGFTQSGNEMTIVVGKDPKCLSSGQFREAFKSGVSQSMGQAETQQAQKRAFDDRNTRGAKLWTIAERQHQATRPGGRYFGER